MPLHVTISLNEDVLDEITIGRLEKFKGRNKTHTYLVRNAYGHSAQFEHRYDDMAHVCVERALEALRERGKTDD